MCRKSLFLGRVAVLVGVTSPALADLLVHYGLNETVGSVAHDSVGANDGSVSGSYWTTPGANANTGPGCVRVGDGGTLHGTGGGPSMREFTFMFWLKGSYYDWHWIWSAGAEGNHFSFGSSIDHWEFVWNFEDPLATGGRIMSGTWQHLAFVGSGSRITVYIDGWGWGNVKVNSGLDFTEFRITSAPGHTEPFAADIDDVGLWDEALDVATIAHYMGNGIGGSTAGCPCPGNLNTDDQIDLEDLQAVAGILLDAGSPFIVTCE